MKKIKEFIKDKNRQVIVFLSVAVALSVFTYAAISVNNFNDYDPPSTMSIRWGDYYTSASMTTLNTANAVTSYPKWTAEYPYRAILFGMGRAGSSYNPPNTCTAWIYIIYSKKPTTDLFTFEYVPTGDRASSSLDKRGYIRAYIERDKYNQSVYESGSYNYTSDVWILRGTHPYPNATDVTIASTIPNFVPLSGHTSGNKDYFEFDFYYECAGEHQQNAYTANVSGLRSVANVPYPYILKCEEHAPPSGSASSGSGSSTGGGSSSNIGGGGKDRDGNPYSSASSWTWDGSSSRPDLELSVPDDWKSYDGVGKNNNGWAWQDNKNIPDLSLETDIPPFTDIGEGDTGENGDTWEIPKEFDIQNDNPFTSDDVNIPFMPGSGQIHDDDSFIKPGMDYGWPPPNPMY